MAAKKRPSKSAPIRLRRSGARLKSPRAVKTPPMPAKILAPEIEPVQAMHFGPIILAVAVVVGLGWWALKPKSQDMATAPMAPAAAPASAPASAPAAVVAQPAPVAEAKPLGPKREQSDVTTLTFKGGKSWSVRCWRSADSPASLDIFGRRNVRVRSVLSETGAPGWQILTWNGLDDKGVLVAKGEYYALPSQKHQEVILELRVKN